MTEQIESVREKAAAWSWSLSQFETGTENGGSSDIAGQWLWLGADVMLSTLGWIIFGARWEAVQTGLGRAFRIAVLVLALFAAHYICVAAWPAVTVVLGLARWAWWAGQ